MADITGIFQRQVRNRTLDALLDTFLKGSVCVFISALSEPVFFVLPCHVAPQKNVLNDSKRLAIFREVSGGQDATFEVDAMVLAKRESRCEILDKIMRYEAIPVAEGYDRLETHYMSHLKTTRKEGRL